MAPTAPCSSCMWRLSPPEPRRTLLRLDEAAANGVARELDAIPHTQLLEDVGAVTLDGLDADHQLLSNLLVRVCLRDELEHLELARRQHVEPLGRRASLDVLAHERLDGR